jgi:squalene-hopene/tetraprenyl-beta-curcumene cyclase
MSFTRGLMKVWGLLLALAIVGVANAAEPPKYPGPNRADEPKRGEFSLTAAAQFLDAASADWGQNRKCFACHTNFSYLFVQPCLQPTETSVEVRRQLEELVETRWAKVGPRWDAEVVMAAATLALHDTATTKKLHPTTKAALDRMWTKQREDGGINWLKCNWPPMESDDHFGAEMLLIAAGAAPENYAQTEAAQQGIAGVKKYLAANPPPTVHHQAMLLWANAYVPDVVTAEARQGTIERLRELQRPDGGWCIATLGDWQRADKSEQDTTNSDGYATGFIVYVLRKSGVPADDPALTKAVAWLKANQRESGRWFTRSLSKDNMHFLSHAGTAFAVLALDACGATGK